MSSDAAVDTLLASSDASYDTAAALVLKATANTHFKAGEFAEAMASYSSAFELVDPAGEEGKNLMLILINNCAMCSLKLENWSDAQAFAARALQVDGTNAKAAYRLACACRSLAKEDPKQLTAAKKAAAKAFELQKSKATRAVYMEVRELLAAEKVRKAAAKKAAKSKMAKMFQSGSFYDEKEAVEFYDPNKVF